MLGRKKIDYESEYVGKEFDTRTGRCAVLSYEGARYLKVKFLDDYGHEYNVRVDHLEEGATKNPYFPSVFGVGFQGVGGVASAVGGKDTTTYIQWHSMLTRAYCPNYQRKFPTYCDVSVDPSWHNFQTFAQWASEQAEFDVKGYDLDKDLKVQGNRVYSRETCLFIPAQINAALDGKARGESGVPGVYKRDYGYQALIGKFGKRVNVGFSSDKEAATKMYYAAKSDYLLELAEIHKDKMPQTTYDIVVSRANLIRSMHESSI